MRKLILISILALTSAFGKAQNITGVVAFYDDDSLRNKVDTITIGDSITIYFDTGSYTICSLILRGLHPIESGEIIFQDSNIHIRKTYFRKYVWHFSSYLYYKRIRITGLDTGECYFDPGNGDTTLRIYIRDTINHIHNNGVNEISGIQGRIREVRYYTLTGQLYGTYPQKQNHLPNVPLIEEVIYTYNQISTRKLIHLN